MISEGKIECGITLAALHLFFQNNRIKNIIGNND
jgi:hypothetical protein